MKVKLIVIGETDQNEFKTIENQYIKKIKRYTDFECKVLKDPGKGSKLSEGKLKKAEEKLLLKELTGSDRIILLDENGKTFSSRAFANEIIQKPMDANTRQLVFVIGGPFGFSEELRERFKNKLSLSAMTLTHQMVRMVFLEQLYRGYSILKGEKYHHD